MSSYALQGIGHIANFDMHSLKQVYIYVMSVELNCLNQVQIFVTTQKSPKKVVQNQKFYNFAFITNP